VICNTMSSQKSRYLLCF